MAKRKDIKITERGWAGHFILRHRYRFKRNTLIEYKDEKYVVSTVGLLEDLQGNIDNLGLGISNIDRTSRYYETMVFKGIYIEQYIEADVSALLWTDCLSAASIKELNEMYKSKGADNVANDMHEKNVEEVIQMILLREE